MADNIESVKDFLKHIENMANSISSLYEISETIVSQLSKDKETLKLLLETTISLSNRVAQLEAERNDDLK